MSTGQIYLYGIQCVCYASSHDDFIGVFSTEEKANEACDKLNSIEKKRLFDLDEKYAKADRKKLPDWETYSFPWDCPPYYVGKYDVTTYVRSIPSKERTPEAVFERYSEWVAIYQVPSVGEFQLVPKSGTAIEEYKIDEVDYEA